jgi:ribosome assembly protein RRB1
MSDRKRRSSTGLSAAAGGGGGGGGGGVGCASTALDAEDGRFEDGSAGLTSAGVRSLGTMVVGPAGELGADGEGREEDEEEEEEDGGEEEDEGDEEDEEEEEEGDDDEEGGAGGGGGAARAFRPGKDALGAGETLEMDATAYVMYHAGQLEWSCLSMDVVPDRLGPARTRFPLAATVVLGSQADRPANNRLYVARLSNLTKTQPEKRDADSDEEDSDSDSEGEGGHPTMQSVAVPHAGGVNRVRVMPQEPHVVASWADTGKVHLWDIRPHLAALDAGDAASLGEGSSGGGGGGGGGGIRAGSSVLSRTAPVKSHAHSTEGWALDWSRAAPGRLASGSNDGDIHVWDADSSAAARAIGGGPGSDFSAVWSVGGAPLRGHGGRSVEDVQWSPTEAGVLASASCDGTVRIWDTRVRDRAMLSVDAHTGVDVNVISWSRLISYLLASGGDDGTFKIWDLRSFKSCVSHSPSFSRPPFPPHHTTPLTTTRTHYYYYCCYYYYTYYYSGSDEPIALFKWHEEPITSLEWSPDDENVLCVASADDTVTLWDMSLEEDADAEAAMGGGGGGGGGTVEPAQLLFVHAGQEEVREARFHPQLPGVVFSCAADTFNVWRPDVHTVT